MRLKHVVLGAFVIVSLSGCGQSITAERPVWVSTNINGLQKSECNCGGVELKKEFKKRREAQAKAQEKARQNGANAVATFSEGK
jgi:hypothetical protein